jgi:hypothetical protein
MSSTWPWVLGFFVVFAGWAVRVGTPRDSLSVSEAYIFGHWPFIVLGTVLMAAGRVPDWAVGAVDPVTTSLASLVVIVAVVSVTVGSLVVGSTRRAAPASTVTGERVEDSAWVSVTTAAALAAPAAVATVVNFRLLSSGGFDARMNELIVLALLLVPAGVIATQVATRRNVPMAVRVVAIVVVLGVLALTTMEWSRRLAIVTVGAALLVVGGRDEQVLSRRRVVVLAPVVAALAVAGLAVRLLYHHGERLLDIAATGYAERYLSALTMESSAFSGLVVVIKDFGLWSFHGPGSLVAAFVFWLPRELFPWKPESFNLGQHLGTPYSVAPTVYGEALVDLSIVGLVPFCLLLGASLKYLDTWLFAHASRPVVRCVHAVLILDAVFLVRGSFQTMALPMIVHSVSPILVAWAVRNVAAVVSGAAADLRGSPHDTTRSSERSDEAAT